MAESNMGERLGNVEQRLTEGDASFESLRAEIYELRQQVGAMGDDVAKIREIVTAWNSIKGFVQVMQGTNKVLGFLLRVGAFVGALWVLVKTGQWILRP